MRSASLRSTSLRRHMLKNSRAILCSDSVPHTAMSRAAKARQAIQIPDLQADQNHLDGDRLPVAAVKLAGIRTLVVVPMPKERDLVGFIAIYRQEVHPSPTNKSRWSHPSLTRPSSPSRTPASSTSYANRFSSARFRAATAT
jgi:hypothetical protein